MNDFSVGMGGQKIDFRFDRKSAVTLPVADAAAAATGARCVMVCSRPVRK